MVSACSSGIEISNSFSNSMISSTVSSESAPKSLEKLASAVTSLSLTPNLSTMICFTLEAISDMTLYFTSGCKLRYIHPHIKESSTKKSALKYANTCVSTHKGKNNICRPLHPGQNEPVKAHNAGLRTEVPREFKYPTDPHALLTLPALHALIFHENKRSASLCVPLATYLYFFREKFYQSKNYA